MSPLKSLMLLLAASLSFTQSQAVVYDRQNYTLPPKVEGISESEKEVSARIDDYLRAAGVTGGVLIAKNGKVILSKGYGWANDERKIPMTAKTVFDLGSVTKQFTGAGILKLEEQGKLKVTDTITKFFKDVPADKQSITVHQLLTHTAGFSHDVGDRADFPTRDESVRRILNSKLQLRPGEKYSYSNAGYALLAAIIETASGTTYERYLHDNLWKPAGMLKTGNIIPRYTDDELAHGYDIARDWGPLGGRVMDKDGPSWRVRGAGYTLSTLEDLYRWHLALEGEKILSKESKQKYFTPHVPEDDKGSSHYGYGWAIFKTPRNTRLIAHDGSAGIFFADFHRYVDEGVVIIYFNSERNTISRPILSSVPGLFFTGKFPTFPSEKASLSRSELQKYAGTYELPSGGRFELEVINDRLSVRTVSGGVGKLLTTFPKLAESERLSDLQRRTSKVIEHIAREDFEPVRDLIYVESGKFDEERDYWKETFATWRQRYGEFKSSEVVGTFADKELLVTYVFLHFERGTPVVQFRQNEKKQFFIGTSNSLLPRYYRLVPQSKTEFLVYNRPLQTVTPVHFRLGGKGAVVGLTIQDEDGEVYARKLDK